MAFDEISKFKVCFIWTFILEIFMLLGRLKEFCLDLPKIRMHRCADISFDNFPFCEFSQPQPTNAFVKARSFYNARICKVL